MHLDDFEVEVDKLVNEIKKLTENKPRAAILCAIGCIKTEILQQASEEAWLLGTSKSA